MIMRKIREGTEKERKGGNETTKRPFSKGKRKEEVNDAGSVEEDIQLKIRGKRDGVHDCKLRGPDKFLGRK